MDKFYTIRELSQPREIYSDPFMQNVRDKSDTIRRIIEKEYRKETMEESK